AGAVLAAIEQHVTPGGATVANDAEAHVAQRKFLGPEPGRPTHQGPDYGEGHEVAPQIQVCGFHSSSSSCRFLCLTLARADLGGITAEGGTGPTRSRAMARTSLGRLNFFLRAKHPPHRRDQHVRAERLVQKLNSSRRGSL